MRASPLLSQIARELLQNMNSTSPDLYAIRLISPVRLFVKLPGRIATSYCGGALEEGVGLSSIVFGSISSVLVPSGS